MKVNFSVRRRALLVPGIKIPGICADLDMPALIGTQQLSDQPFGTDHILVLGRADIIVGRDRKHFRGKHVGTVRLLVIAEQIQVKPGIPKNNRPV